ncbi:flagellar basal body rod protein [Alteribacter natronophilus]|uniref:lmo0954 family membrane protein n=1 Tax=Alteribacter natronophilus TaxID=2583810 RepID=UPI00110E0233|nr:flagellar basal body rod protein [Alteribacter natronophilus]TMW70080.1 flagellar basal body rod protein [Alteribacter natronophilus]
MKKFLLFCAGLVALAVLLANLGPMIMLAVSVWLTYVIFKQFVKTTSTAGKVWWVIAGVVVVSIGVANSFSVIGLAALAALYFIWKSWNSTSAVTLQKPDEDHDPFTSFEKQWADMNR